MNQTNKIHADGIVLYCWCINALGSSIDNPPWIIRWSLFCSALKLPCIYYMNDSYLSDTVCYICKPTQSLLTLYLWEGVENSPLFSLYDCCADIVNVTAPVWHVLSCAQPGNSSSIQPQQALWSCVLKGSGRSERHSGVNHRDRIGAFATLAFKAYLSVLKYPSKLKPPQFQTTYLEKTAWFKLNLGLRSSSLHLQVCLKSSRSTARFGKFFSNLFKCTQSFLCIKHTSHTYAQ